MVVDPPGSLIGLSHVMFIRVTLTFEAKTPYLPWTRACVLGVDSLRRTDAPMSSDIAQIQTTLAQLPQCAVSRYRYQPNKLVLTSLPQQLAIVDGIQATSCGLADVVCVCKDDGFFNVLQTSIATGCSRHDQESK